MSFDTVDYTKTPILENLIDLCKVKTFTWIQFLCRNGTLTDIEFYDPKIIYVDLEQSLKKITIEFFGVEKDNSSNYKLVLVCNKKYFIYKIVLEKSVPKNEKKQINYYEYKDGYVYPEILYFYDKIKNETTTNKFLISRFYCHIRALFFGTVSIKKICLIDRNKLQKIQALSTSDYNTQKLNFNTMNYQDITFIFFYHPTLNPLENIYGFEYYNTNPVSLLSNDTRIKRPKKL